MNLLQIICVGVLPNMYSIESVLVNGKKTFDHLNDQTLRMQVDQAVGTWVLFSDLSIAKL